MTTITAQDLQYKYSWTTIRPDDPRVTGTPDSTLLNRGEGYEVLPFINRFCEKHTIDQRKMTKSEALKVERMVHSHPGSVRSHSNVTSWIKENWIKF